MVYTITFSPSIDYLVYLRDEFRSGTMNRMKKDAFYYGGKGINVSQVLHTLGIENTALGFVAGFTGKEIEDGLQRIGCKTDFIHLRRGHSRINIKLKSGVESEINATSPDLDQDALNVLYEKLAGLNEDDILVIAGAVPENYPEDLIAYCIEHLSSERIRFIVDTSGDALFNILPYHPFLIKPNHIELSELFNEDFNPSDKDRIVKAAKLLQQKGARNVMVSLASEGALLVTENGQVFSREAPGGIVKNSVGSGDSMVAGFIAGFSERSDYEDAFIMGIAAGSASAFSEGLASGDEIRQMYRLLR